MLRRQVLRYCVVGGINTLVGYSSIFFAMSVLRFGNVAANLCGYVIGFVISYFLNKLWTFECRGRAFDSLFCYAVVLVVSYACNVAVLLVACDLLATNVYVAQLLGVVTYSALAFLGSRYFAFAEPAKKQRGAKVVAGSKHAAGSITGKNT